MNLEELCECFLSHCRSAVSLSLNTMRAYVFDLNDFCLVAGGATPIECINKEVLRSYIRFLREVRKLKESTIKRRIACLKLVFRWAKQESLLKENPFDTLNERIRLPKRLPRALDHDDSAALKSAISPTKSDDFRTYGAKVGIQLMLATGIRVGELVTLKIGDLDMANASLKIDGKGNRQRLVYLMDESAKRHLEEYITRRKQVPINEGWMFTTLAGSVLTTNRMRQLLKKIAQEAGIHRHITPHMLRHTSATTWLEAGLDIRYVQRLLGHQSISTTEIYTHVTNEGLRSAMKKARGDN